jgi:hypothetical protein
MPQNSPGEIRDLVDSVVDQPTPHPGRPAAESVQQAVGANGSTAPTRTTTIRQESTAPNRVNRAT